MKTIKLLFLLLMPLVFLISCEIKIQTGDELKEESKPEQNIVGSDKDAHGCKTSAGYNWSSLKAECIRLFEDGERFNLIQANNNEAVISAFVVRGEKEVELFLPNEKESIRLLKTSSNTYGNEHYLVTDSTISINNKLLYKIQ